MWAGTHRGVRTRGDSEGSAFKTNSLATVAEPTVPENPVEAREATHMTLYSRPQKYPWSQITGQQRQWACDPVSPAVEAPKTLDHHPVPAVMELMNPTTPDMAQEPSTLAPLPHSPYSDRTCDSGHPGHCRGTTILVPQTAKPMTPAVARHQQPWKHSNDIKGTEQHSDRGKCQLSNIARGSSGKRHQKLVLKRHLLKNKRRP